MSDQGTTGSYKLRPAPQDSKESRLECYSLSSFKANDNVWQPLVHKSTYNICTKSLIARII